MENFFRIIDMILPVFIIMGIGFLGKKARLFSESFLMSASRLVFNVFLPINLFMNIYNAEGIEQVELPLVLYCISALIGIVIVFYLIYRKMGFPLEERAIMIQALSRSNIVLFGLSLAGNYFNAEALALISIYIGIISAFSNGFSVLIYEVLLGGERGFDIFRIVKAVLKNAVFIAALAGIFVNISGADLYKPLWTAGNDLAGIASPLGLICIGGTLNFDSQEGERRALWSTVVSKAVIIPVVMLSLFVSIGVRGPELFVMMIIFAAPVAVTTHAMSVIYTSKCELCGKIIVYTTLLNSLTIFLSMYLLTTMGLL